MRIISGIAKGRSISVPDSVARPTTDRTREALFSILNPVLEGAICLDLFAGSGALGLEALSRGAEKCTFIDLDHRSITSIKKNLKDLGLNGGDVRKGDATHMAGYLDDSFDIIFADPPYAKQESDFDFVEECLTGDLFKKLKTGGYFVAESPAKRLTEATKHWEVVTQRTYGSCGITIYQKAETSLLKS